MSLHPSSPRRERILFFGQEGSGKSNTWVSVAEWIAKTNGTEKVYVLDTDHAWDALRPEDGRLDHVVVPFGIHEWDDYAAAWKEIRQSATSDDWFAFDRIDPTWADAQSGYFRKAFGKEVDEFFLMAQVTGEAPGGDYGANWTQIRRMYQAVTGYVSRFPGHVIACAAAEKVSVPDKGKNRTMFHDSVEIEEKYGKYGWKPMGGSSKENIGHLFNTVVFMAESPSGWKMSVCKDRGERGGKLGDRQGVSVTPDVVVAYLMKEGWRP